jgi:hypothetical protein
MLNNGHLVRLDVRWWIFKVSKCEGGVSLRSIPGQSAAFQLTNSYEHDEYGFATEEAVWQNRLSISSS